MLVQETYTASLMNQLLLSGLQCRDDYFYTHIPLIISKNGIIVGTDSFLVRLIFDHKENIEFIQTCFSTLNEGESLVV